MQPGIYVINSRDTKLGTGRVIENDGRYLTVYFEKIDENRDYLARNNSLTQVDAHPDGDSSDLPSASVSESGNIGFPASLTSRVKRDEENAQSAQEYAQQALQEFIMFREQPDITKGESYHSRKAVEDKRSEYVSLLAITKQPFHAMAEVETETQERTGGKMRKKQLFYANEHTSTNLPLGHGDGQINVLSWTHPGIQLALSYDLHDEISIQDRNYTLRSVTPMARAKFFQVLPVVSGIYEPGGGVLPKAETKPVTGLKAIKLQMSREQVDAFLSKMNGMMLVSGAPGSGKTTVAMQRIRFLYDQQDLRRDDLGDIRYAPELTKIFLANGNLIGYSKEMLENELHIPPTVVALVSDFIANYLSDLWTFKHNALLRRKKLFFLEERARQAFFGLCDTRQLRECWQTYEVQIASRLSKARQAQWMNISDSPQAKAATEKLASAFQSRSSLKPSSRPPTSQFNLDAIYHFASNSYEALRALFREEGALERFDSEFQKWLFWVYDPLDCLISYFSEDMYGGGVRIKKGIASKMRENEILADIEEDWKNRTYGAEEIPWLAFLLRFALSPETDQKARFREMPNPLAIAMNPYGERWTHVMVDEAQDLSVPQAALLGSFVHPDGAFTVSADFHQIVSPVWGMENPEAFKLGISLRDKGEYQSFPFAINMRQSKQIGLFLQAFYENVFGEIAPFAVNKIVDGPKPLLCVISSNEFVPRIVQRLNVLKRNPAIRNIALLQINEDETAMAQLRSSLESRGVDLAPLWAHSGGTHQLVTTSVERIKGLEYDACFIVGMDDAENMSLNFARNRAYVALSRPIRHLTIFCTEVPRSLQKISQDMLDVDYLPT